MKQNVFIEEAQSLDSNVIVAIWEETGLTRPWNDPEIDVSLALSGEASTILIARDEANNVVGTCMTGYDGHRGWIYYLAVRSSFQGQGIGKKLFQAAQSWLKDKGCPKIQILIRADNQKVISFYEGIGFEKSTSLLMGKAIQQ